MSFPPIIYELARAMVAVAKARGVHGRMTMRRTPSGDYVIAVVIPAAETVTARAANRA